MLRGFSWKPGINHFTAVAARHHASVFTKERVCLLFPPTRLNRDDRRPDGLAFSVPPSQSPSVQDY